MLPTNIVSTEGRRHCVSPCIDHQLERKIADSERDTEDIEDEEDIANRLPPRSERDASTKSALKGFVQQSNAAHSLHTMPS